jgi:hypothetical protein
MNNAASTTITTANGQSNSNRECMPLRIESYDLRVKNTEAKCSFECPAAPQVRTINLPEENTAQHITIRTGEGDQFPDNLLMSST